MASLGPSVAGRSAYGDQRGCKKPLHLTSLSDKGPLLPSASPIQTLSCLCPFFGLQQGSPTQTSPPPKHLLEKHRLSDKLANLDSCLVRGMHLGKVRAPGCGSPDRGCRWNPAASRARVRRMNVLSGGAPAGTGTWTRPPSHRRASRPWAWVRWASSWRSSRTPPQSLGTSPGRLGTGGGGSGGPRAAPGAGRAADRGCIAPRVGLVHDGSGRLTAPRRQASGKLLRIAAGRETFHGGGGRRQRRTVSPRLSSGLSPGRRTDLISEADVSGAGRPPEAMAAPDPGSGSRLSPAFSNPAPGACSWGCHGTGRGGAGSYSTPTSLH